jgi:hypothetical protein
MERFELEIKEVSEDGTFTGIASVYGIEDLDGDVIDKGAFKKTISENSTIPILWQHRTEEVIGEGTVKEWQGKILLEGRLDLEDPTAQKAYQKIKKKLIKGLSIGFRTIKSSWEEIEGRMIRHISELKLWEVSIVTFAALPDAMVTRVKSVNDLRRQLNLKPVTGGDIELTEQALEAIEKAPTLEARIASLETEIKALQEVKATPVEEPAPTEEPPPETIEPDLHSLTSEQLRTELKGILKWQN